jgi:hypothetical protein
VWGMSGTGDLTVDGRGMKASSVGWGMSGVRGSDNDGRGMDSVINGLQRDSAIITYTASHCMYSVTHWFCIRGWGSVLGLGLCGGEWSLSFFLFFFFLFLLLPKHRSIPFGA